MDISHHTIFYATPATVPTPQRIYKSGEYLKKGKLVAVEGRLQYDSYEKNGEKVITADVVADQVQMLDRGTPMDTHVAETGPDF